MHQSKFLQKVSKLKGSDKLDQRYAKKKREKFPCGIEVEFGLGTGCYFLLKSPPFLKGQVKSFLNHGKTIK